MSIRAADVPPKVRQRGKPTRPHDAPCSGFGGRGRLTNRIRTGPVSIPLGPRRRSPPPATPSVPTSTRNWRPSAGPSRPQIRRTTSPAGRGVSLIVSSPVRPSATSRACWLAGAMAPPDVCRLLRPGPWRQGFWPAQNALRRGALRVWPRCRSWAGELALIGEGKGSIFGGLPGTGPGPRRSGAFSRGQSIPVVRTGEASAMAAWTRTARSAESHAVNQKVAPTRPR